jgi:hypothetical protein
MRHRLVAFVFLSSVCGRFFLFIKTKGFTMTRILQLRRGTTAANDNFTGCAGELTMDTEKNTIRIHDGRTLGGFQMARADIGSFDITTVSDEFWASLFARHNLNMPHFIDTTSVPINSTQAYIDYILGDVAQPQMVYAYLVCQNPSAGYVAGDCVAAFGIGDRANPQPNITHDRDGYHIKLMVGCAKFWVSHRDTGITTPINDSDWHISFRLYC